ncbi:MAG: imidazolonepropionase [Calditrichia bacterium]|nr:imidazolonepropionase [Calditrichia bacterium]MCK5454592.1 imidazolonepropionase [Calditrichia bacterium]
MSIKILTHIQGIVTPRQDLSFGKLDIRQDVGIAFEDEHITAIDSIDTLRQRYPDAEDIDGKNCWALPGFVDPHTHPVFYKTREDEFEMRIQGKSYEEIAAEGGGIRNSVRAFRKASFQELMDLTYQRILQFLEYGTTTIEAKSGYGLSLEDELKSLRILKKIGQILPITIVPTFLGAHEVPDEYQNSRQVYLDIIINEMIPAVAEENLAEFCDVFTEKNVFNIAESEKILQAAKDHGLQLKLHADELSPLGGAELAAKMGAASADHLLMISEKGITAMKESGVVAVLLPGTAFFLGKSHYAPARKMIQAGVKVALATDYNPGSSFTQNMNLILSLACTQMKMIPAEAIWGATLNSAVSILREKTVGSLEVGKKADIVLFDVPNFRYIPYHYGMNHVKMVIRHGNIVINRPE